MNPETRRVLSEVLKGRYFSKAVDLGCGEGYYSDIMKRHVGYLIGVDHNLGRLSVAREFGGYDEVVYADMREYEIPADLVLYPETTKNGLKLKCYLHLNSSSCN